MNVDAKLLWKAVKNVSLFTKKDGWADAVQIEHHVDGGLAFRTSDDYVGIDSRVNIGTESQLPLIYISPQILKDLEKWLRDKDVGLDVNLDMTGCFTVSEGVDGAVWSTDPIEPPDEGWWNMFTFVMDHVYCFPEAATSFEISPDRMTLLSRLEPKGEYPLSFGHCTVNDKHCTAFKYGPDTFGMIMNLDREALKKAFGKNLKDVVWDV